MTAIPKRPNRKTRRCYYVEDTKGNLKPRKRGRSRAPQDGFKTSLAGRDKIFDLMLRGIANCERRVNVKPMQSAIRRLMRK